MKRLNPSPAALLLIASLALLPTALAAEPGRDASVSLPVTKIPSIPSVPAYVDRNSPAAQLELARHLELLLVPDAPELRLFRMALSNKDGPGALTAFQHWFVGRLKWSEVGDFDVGTGWGALVKAKELTPEKLAALMPVADDLLKNRVFNSKSIVEVGEPGGIDWKSIPPQDERASLPRHLDPFNPLLVAYSKTGNPKYLAKWTAYADDWSINQTWARDQIPEGISDYFYCGEGYALDAIKGFALAATVSTLEADMLPATLARVMIRLIEDYIPSALTYMRSCPQNWTPIQCGRFMELAAQMQGWRVTASMVRDARRMMETWEVVQNLPDGTEQQRDSWYISIFINDFAAAIRAAKTFSPDWLTPAWEQEWREQAEQRGRFLIHHLTAAGEDPIAHRADKRKRIDITAERVSRDLPQLFKEPAIQRLMNAYYQTGTPPQGTAATTEKGFPDYTSECYPYGGYYFLRDGWKADSSYAYMLSSATPGKDFRTVTDNNIVGFNAFGTDLLVTAAVSAYSHNNAPIQVDGKNQFFHAGTPQWGHRGYLMEVTPIPAARRWLTSPRFDVAEGIYNGPYGDLPNLHANRDFVEETRDRADALVKAKEACITGVQHQRWLFAVRGAGLWVIADRMKSDKPHTYSQVWPFPSGESKYPVFRETEIGTDDNKQVIATSKPAGVNLSLYQFGPAGLHYTKTYHKVGDGHYRLYDFCAVLGNWKSTGGEELIVTLLRPRRGVDDDVAEVRRLGGGPISGFSASLKDGTRLQYLATQGTAEQLELGTVKLKAESLLLTTSTNGEQHGVVLGATSGECPDFEFEIAKGRLNRTASISIPIQPVTILPRTADAFVASQQVSLACPTPGVEIRYTTDGCEPTAKSPKYETPFTLTESAVVKARAFRAGVGSVPSSHDGTLATETVRADFTKLAYQEAGTEKTVPGLKFSYYQGPWQILFLFDNQLNAIKSGTTAAPFNLGDREGAGPFAFRYEGYLNVPADGVYTFHAPKEFIATTIMAGYELRLTLDDREWYPGTRRHAFGLWSVALKKGLHPVSIYWADLRTPGIAEKINNPGLNGKFVWNGKTPELTVTVPGTSLPRAIPSEWWRTKADEN